MTEEASFDFYGHALGSGQIRKGYNCIFPGLSVVTSSAGFHRRAATKRTNRLIRAERTIHYFPDVGRQYLKIGSFGSSLWRDTEEVYPLLVEEPVWGLFQDRGDQRGVSCIMLIFAAMVSLVSISS
ncbi:MAG TPA: hypothetical protein DCZ69_01330 [Syntrophobacteraceae bacterium]|nr:hypothetical protein [Syntrophobacteraceae bacterium]HBZ53803.1 hypothetical protein [Syntrophobacteraceae bacterium]